MLPEARGLGGPFACLNEARYGIIWGSMGAARDCYESALAYAKEREQFGKPIASFQLVQEKLANMLIEIAREARTVFGGNGVTLDYPPMRHMSNLESVRTYEGTDEVHTLILGGSIPGILAFR